MTAKQLPAHARLKIERLERENQELRAKISQHMRIYGETLGELVTYKIRCEQAEQILRGQE